MSEIPMKKVDGNYYPASDFAYVPDANEPSTWKLPIFDMRHIGGAEAALDSDYRGNPVEIPAEDIPMVKATVARKKRELMANG